MSVDDSDFDWNCGGGNASGCSGDSRTHYCISGVSLLSEADPFAYFMGRNGKNRDRDLEEKLETGSHNFCSGCADESLFCFKDSDAHKTVEFCAQRDHERAVGGIFSCGSSDCPDRGGLSGDVCAVWMYD